MSELSSRVDLNSLDYWFPKIEAAGLPVPRTTIIRADGDLSMVLDGKKPLHWDEFLALVQAACYSHRLPCFLRTGHGSNKHEWRHACFVEDADKVARNITALVEWSSLADMLGLPTDVWAVRDLIPNISPFSLTYYDEMPYVPEWRFFVRDGTIDHVQPYWPMDALEQGRPSIPNWREVVQAFYDKMPPEAAKERLGDLALRAGEAVGGGYWSVDFLWSAVTGKWYLTDMAQGDRSYRYETEVAS